MVVGSDGHNGPVRIATWNVNSIRSRVDRVVGFLQRHDVDVLAMQETKCRDEQFPHLPFEEAGYQVAHLGINQWNGVAIASRVGIEEVTTHFDAAPSFGDPQVLEPRALMATCGGVRLLSVYVPNGRAVGDPHMDYKLAWLDALRSASSSWLAADPEAQIALLGDWNVAPRDEDVWSVEYFADKTHVTPPERAAFQSVVDAGFTDVVRPYTQGPGVYTYWDYQALRFPRGEGMRIDFVLGSKALTARVEHAFIDRDERKGKGASDHAPVLVDLRD